MTHLSSSYVRTPQSQLYWVRVGVQCQPGAKIQSVPGFSGWGAPLLGTLNYWGGVEDIPNLLLSRGYTVIVSSIGPLSSNWERACELYRQLTCGRQVNSQGLPEAMSNANRTGSFVPTPMTMRREEATTWTLAMATFSRIQAQDPRKRKPSTENGRSYSQKT